MIIFDRNSYKRTAVCPTCQRETVQVRHGYTVDGKLWKGHECLCKGWECTECRSLMEKMSECCR